MKNHESKEHEVILTVEEAIKLCIEYELKVKESINQLESFYKNKCLKTNQKKSLLNKLHCVADDVSILGGGQKSGQVKIKGLKSKAEVINSDINIPDKRANNGKKLTPYDMIVKEYIFTMLCKSIPRYLQKDFTINKLVNMAKLLEVPSKSTLIQLFNSTYEKHFSEKEIKKIKNFAIQNIVEHKRRSIKLYLKHLMHEERIHVETHYMANSINGNKNFEIEKKEYERITSEMKKIAESYGLSLYYHYYFYRNSEMDNDIENPNVEIMNKEIMELLYKNKYRYIFEVKRIKILKYETIQAVERETAEHATREKLFYNTIKRIEKKNYATMTDLKKRFYGLSMFILLREIGVQGLEEIIEEEISTIELKKQKSEFVIDEKQLPW